MTAVASPPTLLPLPRWNSDDEREGLDSMSAEEVTRLFLPRNSVQRPNPSSTMAATPSSSLTTPSALTPTPAAPQPNGDAHTTTGEQGGWGPRKKATRGIWPSSKAEAVSGVTFSRPPVLPTPSSGQAAASTMNSAMHQPSPILPSQNRLQCSSQSNGVRADPSSNSSDPPALLALLPMTGTFERKQIVVPFFPEVLRIGRQTNAKTLPTTVNGYFDSKVLSRQHAEVWAERNGKIWIRDVKSSNGTFVNGNRLSPENRDSEPHELREQDTLELGIDIVSEDQKSIVHHKVSAKVELAGIYPNPPSLLEMELSHNTPNAGNAILGDSMGQHLSHMRGRNGSQGSIGSNGRANGPTNMAGNNLNMMGPHRQVNMWMGPITVEQVMKKLTTELKSAKQQSQDLHQTEKFFNNLLTLQPGEERPKSPTKPLSDDKQTIDMPPPLHLDPISPFSQPPAPPPQQPLPQKPDVAPISIPELLSQPSLKRADTERPRSALGSPSRAESGQIISLVEALKIKTHELDSKVDYIKSLEVDLAREKRAREDAERRALKLSGGLQAQDHEANGLAKEQEFEPPLDSIELMDHRLPHGGYGQNGKEDSLSRTSSMSTITDNNGPIHLTEEDESLAERLQAQLDLRNREMNEMKILMESYRQKADEAEEGRRSLAQMVEDIRAGRDPKGTIQSSAGQDSILHDAADKQTDREPQPLEAGATPQNALSTQPSPHQQNGNAALGAIHRELEKTVSTVLQQQQQHPQAWVTTAESSRMVQSAPYVSMVGVVLIGVGIMTWLNGWQPGGEK